MNRYRPLSRIEINNNLSLGKINKSNIIHRNNLSSFARRINYNNQKFYMTNNIENRNKPKLFSLLDINDKITNSRGTVLPIQYKRLSDEENKRLFGFSYRTDKKYDFSRIQQILGKKSNNTSKNNFNDEINDINKINEINENNIEEQKFFTRYNSDTVNNLKSKKIKFIEKKFKIKNNKEDKEENPEVNTDKKILIENYKNDSNNNNLNKNQKKIINLKTGKNQNEFKKIKNNIIENQKVIENDIKYKTSKDRWFPKGYTSYEFYVKNPKSFSKQLKYNNYINKNFSTTLKQIRDKAYKSDIFFTKNPSEKEVSYKHAIMGNNNQNSDIFNIKNDEQNLLKSSETYLFKRIKGERYNITRESNSKWKPGTNIPTLMNYSSKEYNILSPGKKGISSTKEKIIDECEKRKDNNSKMKNNVNYMNPIYRQKGLAEFIDITRNGASNPGRDFMRTYYNNPRCFFKQNEACNTFSDCYLQYKNICNRPFVKNFI